MVELVVDGSGALPLPWLAEPLAAALARQRGHALLLHGAAGAGTLQFALVLAQAWLCEADSERKPCGRCGSCRLVQQRVHPDLFVLMPEVLRQQHAWPLADDKPESEEGKRKPSKQIRIAEVRLASDWVTRTTARGRAKVVVLHPAEQLNLQAANALLKTLEEPPAGTRLLLTASDPLLLLPTVRSRCQRVPLGAPAADEALAWLAAAGVADADVLLAAASGRPLEAQGLDEAGVDSARWAALPRAVARGEGAVFGGWPLPRVIDALLKLCHDALALAAGGGARYFPVAAVPRAGDPKALADWSRELVRVARYDEHPWHEGLLLDALVSQGQRALTLRA